METNVKKSGPKIAAIAFLILASIAFAIGTTLAVIILQDNPAATAQEQAGQALVTIVLFVPFIFSYAMFALFDLIGVFSSIGLIKNKSKGMGVTTLVLSLAMLTVAIVFIALVFTR